jgi:hypothetical protein
MKVRIALVMTKDGNWNAVGWNGNPPDEETMMDSAIESLDNDPDLKCWLEAEIELPKLKVIQGKVKS